VQRYIDELRLLHALSLAVLATDDGGVVTFANDAATRMFDVSAAELVGRDLAELVGGADADGPLALADVLGGATWRGDLTVRRPRGVTLLAAVSMTPIRNARDAVVGAIVALEDMTEIRRAEAEAVASEQRLRLAHAAAELGTWHWSAPDDTNVWDDQMHHIYGLPPGGFDGTWDAWVGSVHPDDRVEVMAIVQKAMEECSTYVLRNRIVRPDGTMRWIEAHGKVLTDATGSPTGTIGCVQDVTERIETQRRQEDAAARALLLQEVTADFSRASTPDQVSSVLAASLERVRTIVGDGTPLVVPVNLTGLSGSDAFLAGTDRSLTVEDAQLLDTLASQCAIAAARAKLLGRTTAISDELQSSLAASPLPALERFEIAACYAPGGDELEHVGGDWYDAIGTSTGGLVLVVGDVMGRGVRAATTMIHVRAGIRGLLTMEPSPAALLAAADEMIARDAPDQFVTAAAVLVDPEAGTLDLCNAGHLPLLLIRPDRTTALLGMGSGVPLGIESRLHRSSDQVALEPGCIVLLVTDGVVESRDSDLDEGVERLRQRAAELCDRPLQELVDGVAALADTRLRDDVTVVAARLR
jgi:PAS domain S-box-containing protein